MKILSWGDNGEIKAYKETIYTNLVYLITEYISGDNIYNLNKTIHSSGEEGGRYFMKQMIDVLSYLEQ